MENKKTEMDIVYGIEDKPELSKAIPLAFQHILAMFAANITVPLLLSTLLDLPPSETTFLIQCALFMAGVATFIQIMKYKGIGSGLPIVMGTSNAFISTVLIIAKDFGIGGVLGASFIGGLFEILLGKNLLRLKKIFTPLVAGIVVLTIGVTLIPVGIKQAAGGSTNMGDLKSLLISTTVLVIIILFNQSKNKFLKSSSILVGLVSGYLISYFLGMIDVTPVMESSWVSLPKPFAYTWSFKPTAIIAMLFMYVATAIETIGDISALTIGAEGREATDEEMSGGVIADGLGSSIAALFNGFPNTSYTQNIGVVNLTGVFSRHVVKIGGIILIVLSIFPKFGSLIAIMPEPVLGGAAIAMFSMVAVSGLSLLRNITMNSRNMLIIAISLGLGIGLNIVPEATQNLPRDIQLFLTSGVVPAGLVSIILDLCLPNND
ncbi:purine permease [Tissierella pigra]|uniref:Purine permease n=1 Tax=Tissierella pigra TaxID=2607614 RepID=A0A6N7XX44_9FIRM|nr:nucleobase:cation symporter-2 family protein [Tissierella pigra]MBU5428096.1 purine permease [Tissierella pigra]MSU02023.1 purine permease [Tissierella pigra]